MDLVALEKLPLSDEARAEAELEGEIVLPEHAPLPWDAFGRGRGALLALGLAPYLLVIVRSRDPHAYLESRASTLADLGQVILARQFQNRLFTESWTHALTTRGPVIAERVFAADLTIPGLCLAAIGVVWLSWRRPADALLPGLGAAIVTAFAVNYTVVDTPSNGRSPVRHS